LEAAALQQAAGDVVREIPEAEGGAAQVLQAAVGGFGGPVAGAGAVEVGQHVAALFLRVRPRVMTSVRAVGTPWRRDLISVVMSWRPWAGSVGKSVCGVVLGSRGVFRGEEDDLT
jgi:hypothetical protein